jgi:hypothetical protein
MSARDGAVLGLRKIADAGPPAVRWNLVIVSDGYTQAQMAQFGTDANALRDRLLAEPPFNRPELRRAINVYRLDVVSNEQGADKPRCGDGAGTGHQSATYFDSTFCSDGSTQRLLFGNSDLAIETVEADLPEWHQILVLVNDRERGGAGGNVGWSSNGGSDWRDVAIHELGHSAFGLADEYDYGRNAHLPPSGGEPAEPNASLMHDPTRVKWRAHVTASGATATRRNPNCANTDRGPSPVPPATVGTFEGARYHHCGIYRPVWDCKMRTTTSQFCPVCTAAIVRVMSKFAAIHP